MTRTFALFVIGGSAGALEPLLEILSMLPAEPAMPVAVVLHVAPSHPSLLPSLVGSATKRRVREPEDKEPLEPGTIYIAPPNYHMLIERSGVISLSVDEPVNFSRPSIDVLFESAANAFGPAVIGLVLSGANADGAEGLRKITEAGGVALVQDATSAAYREMPAAAAARVTNALPVAPRDVASVLSRFTAAPAKTEVQK